MFLAFTQTLFYSCFPSFQKHRQVHKHALLSPSLPPCDSSHLIPHGFIFYHVCSTDFEENEQAIASPVKPHVRFLRENREEQIDCMLIVMHYKLG